MHKNKEEAYSRNFPPVSTQELEREDSLKILRGPITIKSWSGKQTKDLTFSPFTEAKT